MARIPGRAQAAARGHAGGGQERRDQLFSLVSTQVQVQASPASSPVPPDGSVSPLQPGATLASEDLRFWRFDGDFPVHIVGGVVGSRACLGTAPASNLSSPSNLAPAPAAAAKAAEGGSASGGPRADCCKPINLRPVEEVFSTLMGTDEARGFLSALTGLLEKEGKAVVKLIRMSTSSGRYRT